MLSSPENMLPYAVQPVMVDRRWKPNVVEIAPNCPRCDSSNTKFCYYNNYSLSQPRYFCKGCRRYWTKGGSLRNVPVGGGCRKNRRGKLVRLSSNPVAAPELSYGHRLSGQIRPDLALDGMVGNSSSSIQSMDVSTTTTDGSTIDLALLYAKFSNQRPEAEPGLVVPELPGEIDESLESATILSQQTPVQLPDQHGFMESQQRANESMAEALLGDGNQPSIGELSSLPVDPSGYESLAFPTEGFSSFFSSSCPADPNLTYEVANYQGFGSLQLDDSMGLHQNVIVNDWSSMDYSSLEAFYRS